MGRSVRLKPGSSRFGASGAATGSTVSGWEPNSGESSNSGLVEASATGVLQGRCRNVGRGGKRAYWQASHDSGFSSEQASASSSVNDFFGADSPPPVGGAVVVAGWCVVVLLIRVAGRDRR